MKTDIYCMEHMVLTQIYMVQLNVGFQNNATMTHAKILSSPRFGAGYYIKIAPLYHQPHEHRFDTETLACRIGINDFNSSDIIPNIPDDGFTQNVTLFFKTNF